MQINLTDVLSCDRKVLEGEYPIEKDVFSSPLGSFPIIRKSLLRLRIMHLGADRLRLEGSACVTVVIPCDRCLRDVNTEIPVVIDREVHVRPTVENRENGSGSRGFRENVQDAFFEEEAELIFGYNLDADELVCSEILVSWPMKTLCRESCKGVCRKCGANLNQGSCSCDTVELDPRMAAIRDIFKTVNEEV